MSFNQLGQPIVVSGQLRGRSTYPGTYSYTDYTVRVFPEDQSDSSYVVEFDPPDLQTAKRFIAEQYAEIIRLHETLDEISKGNARTKEALSAIAEQVETMAGWRK